MDEKRIEDAARAAHEVNRIYCREVLGDNSHLLWKDAPEWQRESAIEGVRAIAEDPNLSPADTHARWMARKLSEGWVPGTKKDPVNKTHPCLVNYIHLPLAERVKDAIFGVVVRAALGLDCHVAIDHYEDEEKTDPGRKVQIGQ